MLFGLTQLGGVAVITGEIGCGKTLLAESLRGILRDDGFTIARVANPPTTAPGVLAALVGSLEAGRHGGGTSRLSERLRLRLADDAGRGQRPVVMIDEAQRLDGKALEEIRLLTNPGASVAVPVVLLGQPELATHIGAIPQLQQRVVVRYHLEAMSAPEVAEYIRHRTRVAGATRRLFSERAAVAIHAETRGVPRLVNLMCANALFVGYARGESQVAEDLIRDLAEDRRAELAS